MSISDTIQSARRSLPPAELRVAEVVAADPEVVAFGTVAQVARKAATSGPSVVRLAERLGFDGFVGLQAAVRAELSERLRPAHERIRVSPRDDVLGHTLAVEVENVRRTLEAADPEVFAAAVERLADPERRVSVLPSEQCVSAAENLASSLSLLRDGVRLLTGSEFRVTSQLARMRRTATVVLIDLQRHETWFLRTAERVVDRGAHR
ncbi:MAG: MurR/RpiR family transcriptional regulator, partial [Proteobacteria bacterium]|nr:MurR/RpiR family transcriptional regulator [Pseudomonadota bacterium]